MLDSQETYKVPPPLMEAGWRKGATFVLLNFLPDFCWQTSDEVVSMMEQIDEEISEGSLRVTLSKLAGRGLIEKQNRLQIPPSGYGHVKPRRNRVLYRRALDP
jgi:hypothetical protein